MSSILFSSDVGVKKSLTHLLTNQDLPRCRETQFEPPDLLFLCFFFPPSHNINININDNDNESSQRQKTIEVVRQRAGASRVPSSSGADSQCKSTRYLRYPEFAVSESDSQSIQSKIRLSKALSIFSSWNETQIRTSTKSKRSLKTCDYFQWPCPLLNSGENRNVSRCKGTSKVKPTEHETSMKSFVSSSLLQRGVQGFDGCEFEPHSGQIQLCLSSWFGRSKGEKSRDALMICRGKFRYSGEIDNLALIDALYFWKRLERSAFASYCPILLSARWWKRLLFYLSSMLRISVQLQWQERHTIDHHSVLSFPWNFTNTIRLSPFLAKTFWIHRKDLCLTKEGDFRSTRYSVLPVLHSDTEAIDLHIPTTRSDSTLQGEKINCPCSRHFLQLYVPLYPIPRGR